MNKVFVYGTLMSNYSNSGLLIGSRKIGRGVTMDDFVLYCSVIPFVVECPYDEQGYGIRGELYDVDDATLSRLDALEGHPHWYERKQVDVAVNRIKYTAWMYIFPMVDNGMTRCTEGDYRNYITDMHYGYGNRVFR